MWMKKRKHWEETSYYNTIFNFKWQPTSKGIKFDLVSKNGQKQMVNHFENHKAITTKDNLFRCLHKYWEAYVYDYVPITFLIESNSDTFKVDIEKFKIVFNILKPYDEKFIDADSHVTRINEINKKLSGLTWFTCSSMYPHPHPVGGLGVHVENVCTYPPTLTWTKKCY